MSQEASPVRENVRGSITNMNNIKKIEAWERIQRRYIKSEQDVEETISKIGNDLRKDRAFVIAFAKVRKSIDPSFAD